MSEKEGESQNAVIETKDLVKTYGLNQEVHALDGVNFKVMDGEFVAIIGPSGSGKSTLLNMLGALDRPTTGDVLIRGESLARVKDLDRFRQKMVGFVFQTHNLIPTLTALENVEVPMQGGELKGAERRARALELLTLVGLAKRVQFLPNQMSGGERQRVAIARALANRPAIVLADEPTGNLDSQNTHDILDLLADLNRRQGVTLIVVTHNTEVARVSQRVVTIRDGKIHRDRAVDSSFASAWMEFENSMLAQLSRDGDDIPPDWRGKAAQVRGLLDG